MSSDDSQSIIDAGDMPSTLHKHVSIMKLESPADSSARKSMLSKHSSVDILMDAARFVKNLSSGLGKEVKEMNGKHFEDLETIGRDFPVEQKVKA